MQRLDLTKKTKLELVLELGLSSCTEWILSFVQEMGLRTCPKGSWFHQKSLPEFLDLWSIDLVPQKKVKNKNLFQNQDCFQD